MPESPLAAHAREKLLASARSLVSAAQQEVEQTTPDIACPHCGASWNKVRKTKPVLGDNAIRRRRECEACHQRFSTVERIAS